MGVIMCTNVLERPRLSRLFHLKVSHIFDTTVQEDDTDFVSDDELEDKNLPQHPLAPIPPTTTTITSKVVACCLCS